MKFKIDVELNYQVAADSTLILNIHALKTATQKIPTESFETSSNIPIDEFSSVQGEHRSVRLSIPKTKSISISYKAEVENYYALKDCTHVPELKIDQLNPEIFLYLYPSRYCPSDKLYNFANNLFGPIENDFNKVIAITNWIYKNIRYRGGASNSQTSALETLTEQVGVCRDFAHLGITFCRALTIPARYFTAYAYQLKPQDFHACFEAYINGNWILFDATRLAPLNGMIKIASGRDAADTAFGNLFGEINFKSSKITCDFVGENFIPFHQHEQGNQAVSYS
jgi:transglutaminase-like putative cysteine protease